MPQKPALQIYLRSGIHVIGITVSAWAVQLYFTSRRSRWIRKWPLMAEIGVRSLVMAIVATAVAIGLQAALYQRQVGLTWLVTHIPRIIGLTFVILS